MSTDSEDPGVYLLPITVDYGGRELTITPTAVETDRGLVLIDVGPPGAVDGLRTHLRGLGFDLEDVWLVLVTHHDGDHVGGLEELLERVDPIVATHREEAPYVTGDRDPIKGDPDEYRSIPIDLEITGGARVPTVAGPMEIVETPGHSPGHVSLHFSDHGLLLAGDALVADGDEPLSGPKPEFTPDMERAAESVGRLADLEIEQVVCFHGGHAEAGSERLAEINEELRG
ncbi:beta-lactamase domain protein [Natronococcus amylolyticus DSM 10524]|uniref:Beta-lactamase domain protein n=1 Tax=Natronococcus amylolyticus DSM 10524 TaxID=1227497 RepID=L9WVW1_9EURY|nr:MBL fold metallo-hydrolase [Natronococcus amylolyticus]ELY53537.1 beta-lactamase domain protein [Natronococcus amylolyticus DSM 10524]